jgi:hypothetical protein
LLLDGDFSDFNSLADAERMLAERSEELAQVLRAKAERDAYALLLEHVADELAGRHPQYKEGLTQTAIDLYEPDGERKGYLMMQDLIAGMMLGERAYLGEAFHTAVELRKGGSGLVHVQGMIESHPDHVFIFGSFAESNSSTRNDLILSYGPLARAAMSQYERTHCLVIFDRGGKRYEVGLVEMTGPFSPEDVENGRRIFGHLKIFGKAVHVRPAL